MRLLLPPALCLLALTGLKADVSISEFLADNLSGIKDENDSHQDWIELYNPGAAPVSLDGWWLTDNPGQTAKWQFPNVSIPAGGTLLVWASGKDRRVAGQALHTNFSLAKSGEYLGLYQPAAGTGLPELVDQFEPAYPAQAPDISYGVSISQSTATLVASNSAARYKVLTNDATGAANYNGDDYGTGNVGTGLSGGWNVSPAFVDSSWPSGTTGLGYDTGSGLQPWIVTDCQAGFQNVNTSLLFRHTFKVPNPGLYSSFKLRMKFEDGFVAYLNGTEIGRVNFSGSPAYNSKANAALDETIVNSWTEFNIPPAAVLTNNNLLAIQGMNSSVTSSDFLLLPEITAATGLVTGNRAYFSTPTPNSLNGAGTSGPVAHAATPGDSDVPRPTGTGSSPPLAVSVSVIQTQYPVSAVQVIPRVMFNSELSAITMLDNGVTPDLVAGDMIFSAVIPTNMLGYGQMLRWRFEVHDSAGNTSRLPAYLSTTDSPQYFGTVAQRNDLADTQLPVMDWFVEGAPGTGPTASAFRGCMYFLGYFYDNIGHEIHGQSTTGMPKKSYDFDSNTGYRFLWQTGEGRLKDLNMMSNYADKTKTRNTLSHEIASLMGAPYHFCKPVRMHLNAGYHGVMDMMEDGDDRMLERNGLDPEGAFYKIYNETMDVSPEKKTRKTEPNTDINTLTISLDPALPLSTRRAYAYDNINIPAAINYLVTRQLNSDTDHGHKNYYLYRDTNGSGEWTPIIWDVDLSQGHQWNGNNGTGGYFNDSLITNNPLNRHIAGNRLYNILLESPEFQQMFARRMRTAMDTILQPPGSSNGYFESRLRAIAASVDPDPANPSQLTDGDLDHAKWGMNGAFIDNRPREEVERVITGYLGPRRTFIFDQSASRPLVQKPGLGGGTPLPNSPQSAGADSVRIDSVDFLPPGVSQNAEYILLKNTTSNAVDISGWTLDGGVEHRFIGGTVIPSGAGSAAAEYRGLLHVVKNSAAFRSRPSGPSGRQNRLVQGNYSGQLSARGESVNLRDASGLLISSYTYTGTPTPLQQYLRIAEIQYHPANPTTAENLVLPGLSDNDFEYLELVNIGPATLGLTGARFVQGIDFTFPSASLAAGARVIVAKNPAAFTLRYPAAGVAVLGPYEGDLDNAGERLELTDAVGENILDFTYKDGWYPATDGSGRSLVLRNPAATPYDDFGDPIVWAISGGNLGSPGSADASLAQAYHGWDNFHFTSPERDDPLISGPAADPDGDGRKNADEYALGTNPRLADLPVFEFTWSMDGETRRPALRFHCPANPLDVTYELLAGGTLNDWPVVSTTAVGSNPLPGNIEEVIFRDAADDSSPGRFLRLRYTVSP